MELNKILQYIEDEPEFPGEPPEHLKKVLESAIHEKDANFLIEVLRIVVKETKKGIANRIKYSCCGTETGESPP